MGDTVEATFYLRIKGKRSYYSKVVSELSAESVTKAKPGSLGKDTIAVKLKLRLPIAAFEAFAPSATIDIPIDLIAAGEIEVEAVDPTEDDE